MKSVIKELRNQIIWGGKYDETYRIASELIRSSGLYYYSDLKPVLLPKLNKSISKGFICPTCELDSQLPALVLEIWKG